MTYHHTLLRLLTMLLALPIALYSPAALAYEIDDDTEEDYDWVLGGDLKHLQDKPAVDLATSANPVSEYKVMAQEDNWQGSGVKVIKGRKYTLKAEGKWRVGFLCGWSDPGGANTYSLLCLPLTSKFVKQMSHASLIAKIGEKGVPFGIGKEHTFTADSDGVLFLRSNDTPGMSWDNQGYANVTISLQGTRIASTPRPVVTPGYLTTTTVTPGVAPPMTQVAATPIRRIKGQRWAVIIGISEYHDSRIPALRYPARDAQSFYDWIVSPQGGRYSPSHVKLLLNKDATGISIRNALFTWLRQAIEEDVVMIYFAGHGSPDSPDTPDNLYLLPFDTQYDNISSTGFPMWDIETALKRFIKARRVIVMADACHSGGVGQSFDIARRSNPKLERNSISLGFQSLSTIGEGVAVISASDANQFSYESEKFGGGHGVFTYYLVKGLKGEADYNKNGVVSLGELIPYLSENVRRATINAQSPTIAGKFDPALTIAR